MTKEEKIKGGMYGEELKQVFLSYQKERRSKQEEIEYREALDNIILQMDDVLTTTKILLRKLLPESFFFTWSYLPTSTGKKFLQRTLEEIHAGQKLPDEKIYLSLLAEAMVEVCEEYLTKDDERFGACLDILTDASKDKKAPIGLHFIGFHLFNDLEWIEKRDNCHKFLQQKLNWILKDTYFPLELPNDQKAIKQSKIDEKVSEHFRKGRYKRKPFCSLVEKAAEGELDGIIINQVKNYILNEIEKQNAQKRGAQDDKVEIDGSDRPHYIRKDMKTDTMATLEGKIDEAYRDKLSVDFETGEDAETKFNSLIADLTEITEGQTGREMLNFCVDFIKQHNKIPTQKEIARGIGTTDRTIRTYQQKHRKHES